jgi:hypothetical protein
MLPSPPRRAARPRSADRSARKRAAREPASPSLAATPPPPSLALSLARAAAAADSPLAALEEREGEREGGLGGLAGALAGLALRAPEPALRRVHAARIVGLLAAAVRLMRLCGGEEGEEGDLSPRSWGCL